MLLRALAALLALSPTAALADVTARYQVGPSTLVIEADAGGDFRAGIGGQFEVIRRAGVDYLIINEAGSAVVFELVPFLAAVKQQYAKPEDAPTGPPRTFVLSELGAGKQGERSGRNWTVGAKDGRGNKIEVLMSSDPALTPVGAAVRHLIQRSLVMMAPIMGSEGGNFAEQVEALFAKGTPLQLTLVKTFTLQFADTAEIADARFVLPGPVMPAEVMAQAMSGQASGAAMPPPLP